MTKPRQEAPGPALLPEVWDAAGRADAGAGHHQHPPVALRSEVLGDLLQAQLPLTCAAAAAVGEEAARPIPALGVPASKRASKQWFTPRPQSGARPGTSTCAGEHGGSC